MESTKSEKTLPYAPTSSSSSSPTLPDNSLKLEPALEVPSSSMYAPSDVSIPDTKLLIESKPDARRHRTFPEEPDRRRDSRRDTKNRHALPVYRQDLQHDMDHGDFSVVDVIRIALIATVIESFLFANAVLWARNLPNPDFGILNFIIAAISGITLTLVDKLINPSHATRESIPAAFWFTSLAMPLVMIAIGITAGIRDN